MAKFLGMKLPSRRSKRNFKAQVNKAVAKYLYGQKGARVPMFEDLPTKMDWRAYEIIYEQDTCLAPARKLARKCGAFRAKISGGGERGKALNTALKHSVGLHDIQEWLAMHGEVEGVAFAWLMGRPHGKMNVLDFRGCGGRKLKAGGNYWWDGWAGNSAVRFSPKRGNLDKEDEAVNLDRNRLCVFTPTASINPEGDTRLAFCLLRIAWISSIVEQSEQVHAERFSIPKEIIKRVVDGMNPDDVDDAFTNALGEIEDSLAVHNLGMDMREKLEIVEVKGKTWEFLKELRSKLEARAHRLLTGEIQSGGGAGEKGDRGGHDVADKQLFAAAKYLMVKMGESWTMQVLPFLESINDFWLPKAGEDDPPMKITFQAPIEKQRVTPAETIAAIQVGYPLKYGFIDDVFGHESGEDPDKKFISPTVGQKVDKPSSTGEGVQRKDRAEPDSGMPAENEKNKQDLRNVGKEDE